jgi:hypothetical protein
VNSAIFAMMQFSEVRVASVLQTKKHQKRRQGISYRLSVCRAKRVAYPPASR